MEVSFFDEKRARKLAANYRDKTTAIEVVVCVFFFPRLVPPLLMLLFSQAHLLQ